MKMTVFGRGQSAGPLLGKNDLPLRLFTVSGYPVTDVDGCVLQSVAGDPLAQVNPSLGIFKDAQGRDLTDAANHIPNHPFFDPTQQPAEVGKECEKRCSTVLYDFKGRPLTDSHGRPLLNRHGEVLVIFGPRGEPVSDFEGKQILDGMGFVVKSNSVRLTTSGQPSYLFDERGRPLTDSLGFALLDLCGVMMIVVDLKHVPIRTVTDGCIYDARGSPSEDSNFDSSLSPHQRDVYSQAVTIEHERGLAFNGCGQPLTDLHGAPLCFSSGSPMLRKKGSLWFDSDGNPAIVVKKSIFDHYTLRGFKNSKGEPILLFNRDGWPLTDINGTPQNHANGQVLISFNSEMDPVSDWLGQRLYDSFGHTLSDPKFTPCRKVSCSELPLLLEKSADRSIQYFNRFGFPLTNRFGVPLLNPEQKPMLRFDNFGRPIKDINGNPVFDITGLPIVPSSECELRGPSGLPIRLYDIEGKPITTRNGYVLKSISGKPYIRIGSMGRLLSDCKNSKMYDKNLQSADRIAFNATTVAEERCDRLVHTDGRPLSLYDQKGYPLTDPEGFILYDNHGKPLVKCSPTDVITTVDGKKVFDVNGYPCFRNVMDSGKHSKPMAIYDEYGRPLTDQFGKILKNRKGNKLIRRKYGEPIDTLYGGGLYDIYNVILDDPEAEPNFSLARETNLIGGGSQLFDCEDLPVTDNSGDMLYTSSGIALLELDKSGKPHSDYIGRPVFDERGLPVTKTSGCWKDQKGRPLRLFNYLGFPVTDYNGCPLRNPKNEELVREDDAGRPIFDFEYRFVKDSKGRNMLDDNFKPLLNDKKPDPLFEVNGTPLRVFNHKGWPLTNEQGHPLVNAKGKCLLVLKNGLHKIKDCFGRQVFDIFGRPMGCDPQKPMFGRNSEPYLLYNVKGHPLTSSDGTPLNHNGVCALQFDKYGRPSGTSEGGSMFDSMGHELFKPSETSTSNDL